MSVLDDISMYRQEISTDTYTTTWREIVGQYKDGDLKIDPEYQRLFRWDVDQQTQYIESILLNIPSPPLFLATNPNGAFEVIDGLQRVSTLIKFFSNEVFDAKSTKDLISEGETEPENDITKPLVLVEGPIITSLEGFDASTLPEALVRTIRYARITVILLEQESSSRARYEVFKRLNKQGSILSDQEIRNCTARILGKEFPSKLRELSKNPIIQQALCLSPEDEKKMRVDEMVLRLLAFQTNSTPLKHNVSEFLDEFMAYAAEGKFKLTPEIEARIVATFDLINRAYPDGRAFRYQRGGFSTNLFDVIAVGVFSNLDKLAADTLPRKIESLLQSTELRDVTGGGANSRRKMTGRVSLGRIWFAN